MINVLKQTASTYRIHLLIFIVTFGLSFYVYLHSINMLDEGALLHIAERVAKGEVLYRDIATGIMPGVYYMYALLFSLFGYSVEVGRYAQMIVLSTNALLVYVLSLRFTSRGVALCTAALFVAVSLFSYRLPNYSPVSVTFILSGLILFMDYLSKEKPSVLLLSSLCISLSFIFKQNYGTLVFLPLALVVMVRAARVRTLREPAIFLSGFLFPVLIAVAYFYLNDALSGLIRYTFLSIFSKALPAYYKPYPFLDLKEPFFFTEEVGNFTPFLYLTIWSLKEKYITSGLVYAIITIVYLLPFVIILLSAFYLSLGRLSGRGMKESEAALFLASTGLFLGVFPRSDFHHLSFVLPPLMVLAGVLFQKAIEASKRPLLMTSPAVLMILAFFSLSVLSTYLPLFSKRLKIQNTPLAMERAGVIKVDDRSAMVIRSVVGYLRDKTGPKEEILVVPTDSMYYFLANRKNATRFPLILPGAMDEQEVIEALERKKVRYIVYTDVSFDEQPFSTQLPLLYKYIKEKYHVDPEYPLREKPAETYVLKRGPKPREKVETINFTPGDPWLRDDLAEPVVFYDFIENLPQARREIILERGRRRPLYRENQVEHSAWLMKEVLKEIPAKNWTKVSVSYGLRIPEGAALSFSTGLSPGVWFPEEGDGSLFEIYIYDTKKGNVEKVFSRYIDPKNNIDHRKWFNYLLSLKAYEGRNVIISFVTSGGPRFNLTNGRFDHWRHFDKAGWGEPRIVLLNGKDPGAVHIQIDTTSVSPEIPDDALKKMALFEPGLFEEEARKNPDDFDVRFALGRVYDSLGYRKKAIKEFEAALALNPSHNWVRSLLINRSIELKRYARAEALLKDSLESDPENFQFHASLAKLYRVTKRFKEAQKWYKKALEIRPDHKWARLGLGAVYLSLKKYDLSEREAKKVIELDPANSGAYILLGDSLRFKGDKEGAERSYRRAIELNPQHPHAHAKLGMLLEAMGRPGEAMEHFRRALELQPENRFFRERLRRIEDKAEKRR